MNISFSSKQKDFLCEIATISELGNSPIPLELVDMRRLEGIINRFKSKIELTGNRDMISISPDNERVRIDLKLISSVQGAVLRVMRGDDSREYISVLGLPQGVYGQPYFPE
ncbi:MAG: hypothetical protein PHQ95_00345 [Candidatus Gracilibacteria bacterium]|nr:hypothetical protein [Candidatus Gracilibacteria bacterium]